MLAKRIVHKIMHFHLLMAALLVLSSCSTTEQSTISSTVFTDDSLDGLLADAAQAERLTSPQREQRLIAISENLARQYANWEAAQQQLEKIEPVDLNDEDYLRFTLIASEVYLQTLTLANAKTLAFSERTNLLLDRLTIRQQKQLHRIRAEIYQQLGDITSSLNEYIAVGTLLSDITESQQNNNDIWQQLSGLPLEELETLVTNEADRVLQGWLDLAVSSKQAQGSIEAQQHAIANWSVSNPQHPASQQLPEELQSLTNIVQNKPKHIALLLPLQGRLTKAGHAIRDGFMAAYYNSKDQHYDSPSIRFYDTSKNDIQSIYDQAVTNGANLVIGPLVKSRVETLQQKVSKPVPILALNYLEDVNNSLQQPFYQFGLSLEDEALQVADRAWREGHRNALVLSSSANWSTRAASAFTERWQQYGGKIIATTQFNKNDNFSTSIEQMLNITQSKQRASALKKLFGRPLEFEPRRRRDIDMIFLLARSKEGRQIKPTLNFHYAGDVPVYATSQIYSSFDIKDKNVDLNGIRLTTLPWIINNSIQEKELIKDNITITPGYERLYALGADSFLLYPRLLQLQSLGNYELYGSTGQLSMNNKRIQRKQVWATISKGEIKALRTLMLSSEQAL